MSDIAYGIDTSDILQQLKAYLLDKEIDGKEYTRIVVLVPTLEEAVAEIERLRGMLTKIAKHPDTPMIIKQYARGELDGTRTKHRA